MSENMASIDDIPEGDEVAPPAPTPPKRGPGHRGQDVRDTMAEMAAKAHEISLEAGSRMAGTMREVIGAAAGLTAFAIESARDLVQYMVRRGQMSQDEADKLMREVEAAHATLPKPAPKAEPVKVEAPKKVAAPAPSAIDVEPPVVPRPPKPVVADAPKVTKVAPPAPEERVVAKPATPTKVASKPTPAAPTAPVAKSAAAKSAPAEKVVKSVPTKTASKPAAKAPAKPAAKVAAPKTAPKKK